MQIKNQVNFASGMLFMLVGGGAATIASTYPIGTAANMGPGFFPFWLGLVLAALGVIVAMSSLKTAAERLTRWHLSSMAIILGSVVLFAGMLEATGLIVSLFVMVVLAGLASHDFTWRGSILTGLLLSIGCYLLFVHGLDLYLPALPTFLRH